MTFHLTSAVVAFSPGTKHFGNSRHTLPRFALNWIRLCGTRQLDQEQCLQATVYSKSPAFCHTNNWLVSVTKWIQSQQYNNTATRQCFT